MTGTSTVVPSLTIAIISSQYVVRLGLQEMFRNGETRQILVQPHQRMTPDVLLPEKCPDVVILDMETERDIIGSLRQIKASAPKCKIVLLSGFENKARMREAFECGVDGVILKVQPPEVVRAVIKALYPTPDNGFYLERKGLLLEDLRGTFEKTAEFETHRPVWLGALTEREREVTTLVGQGLSNKEIAYRLSIADSTVRHHLTNIFDKVGVPNRQKLLIHAHHGQSTLG
ncbi:MAG: response regulator transcription factor [Nitrospira sp.]|nr:response regulator transcription factor [Nitrospira sp.]